MNETMVTFQGWVGRRRRSCAQAGGDAGGALPGGVHAAALQPATGRSGSTARPSGTP